MKKYTFEDIKKQGLLLYEFRRGSHLYGLSTPSSDEDYGGVYLAPAEQLIGLGLDYQSEIHNETNDIMWYELNKFMLLLLKSNPTVLEALFADGNAVLYEHPIMTELKKYRDKFITKQCFKPFGGYAVEQIRKCRGLNKKIVNPVTKRLEPLDFAYTFYNQGSSNIKNWLEHRGLKQQYCGLVNIPNMHDVYGCYYDWGNFFLNEGIDILTLGNIFQKDNAYNEIYKYEMKDIVAEIKRSGENEDLLRKYHIKQLCNLVDFIRDFYNIHNILQFCNWYNKQIPIGYKGMVGEDGMSNELRLSSVSKGEKPICWVSYNQTGYQKHCIDYRDYKDWEKHRNPVRYESNLNKNYDAKNVSHAFRLIAMCTEIAQGKGFIVNRRGIDREFLLDVKNHKYEYDEVISMLDERKKVMDEAIAASTLPEDIDVEFVNDLLINIRKEQLKLK